MIKITQLTKKEVINAVEHGDTDNICILNDVPNIHAYILNRLSIKDFSEALNSGVPFVRLEEVDDWTEK
nr:MAG TPA: hypothetical protein [Caudoviricetes sp.]